MERKDNRMKKGHNSTEANKRLADALWRIYHRPDPPVAFRGCELTIAD